MNTNSSENNKKDMLSQTQREDLELLSVFKTESDVLVVGMLGSGLYALGESLGRGTFGRVWHVVRASDRLPFVAKLIQLNHLDPSSALRARSEVSCLLGCRHFACVRLIEHFQTVEQNGLLIIMEYCDAGDIHFQLRSMRQRNQNQIVGFEERETRLILVQIALALYHMHKRKMLHRDIKAANVLLSTAGLVKIGDFGLSREYDNSRTIDTMVASTFCGTADYLAPEVWLRQRYGSRADVWSLGVLTYECLVGQRPFVGPNLRDDIVEREVQYPANLSLSPEFRHLLDAMLQKNPQNRITVRGLLAHECMQHALSSFTETVRRTRRLTDEQRAFVLEGIAEAADVTSPAPAREMPRNFEGQVAKLKGSEYVSRYLILRDGFLGIFRDDSARDTTLNSRNAKAVHHITGVREVVGRVNNAPSTVFVIQMSGSDGQLYDVCFASPDCEQWVTAIRSAMVV